MKPNRKIALIVSATMYIGGVAWGAAQAPAAPVPEPVVAKPELGPEAQLAFPFYETI